MVSVIVPVYNAEKYLHECVDSILAQTFSDFELLLVDDGSTDNSGAICNEYAQSDARVRVFHRANGGVSSARNFGIVNAKGEFIVFADADDILPDESLAVRVDAVLHNDADIVILGYECFGICDCRYVPDGTFLYRDSGSFRQDFRKHSTNGFIESLWNKVYRKSLMANLRFDETISYGEDYMFNLGYLSNCNRIMLSPKIVYKYRCIERISLSKCFPLTRLYDIDKFSREASKYIRVDGCNMDAVMTYYIDHIYISIWEYLGNAKMPFDTRKRNIQKWYACSLLRELPVNKWNNSWKHYFLRLCLRYSWFRCADIIFNTRRRFAD